MNGFKKISNDYNKRKRILNVSHPSKFLISEDHAYFDGNSCCPLCSIYGRRVYSVSGKDKRFPSLVSLPDEIHDGKCDICNCYYSLSTWFESVSDVISEIQRSNAPFVDRRTAEQIEHFEKQQAKLARQREKQKNNK